MRTTLAAALLMTLPLAAQAQDRPQIMPTRDVAVTYRVTTGGQNGEMTMAWSAASRTMRMNMPGGMGYVVADHANQRGFMVIEQARMIMDVPLERAGGMQAALENARFARGGTATVAGNSCTIWQISTEGRSGEACITADGVLLRSQGSSGGQQGGMEATSVTYAAQNPAQFQRPAGYQTMPAGQMPPGAGRPSR